MSISEFSFTANLKTGAVSNASMQGGIMDNNQYNLNGGSGTINPSSFNIHSLTGNLRPLCSYEPGQMGARSDHRHHVRLRDCRGSFSFWKSQTLPVPRQSRGLTICLLFSAAFPLRIKQRNQLLPVVTFTFAQNLAYMCLQCVF